jgi:DNA-binding beta-propeller fold protein YncE
MRFRIKKMLRILFIILIISSLQSFSQSPKYRFEVFAGSKAGFKDAQGKEAQMHSPEGIAIDKDGNLYTTEYRTSIIRKIDKNGNVTLLAGQSMKTGFADGKAAEALIDRPHGIELDQQGNVYFCDMKNNLIRKIDKNGIVSTFAGTPQKAGNVDDKASEAQFYQSEDLAFDSKRNMYVADTYNFTIRKIDKNGIVSTFAGKAGVGGYADGKGTEAMFNKPLGIAIDKKDNIYVADADYDGKNMGNCLIRKIDLAGNVSTLAGIPKTEGNKDGTLKEATFHRPVGIAVDKKGNIYVADTEGDVIRFIDKKGNVSTIGGQYLQEKSAEGIGTEAAFFDPQSLVVAPNGDIFIADTHNSKIIVGRKVK